MLRATAVQASPFHEGEQRIQQALGVREQIEPFARRVVRSFLPEQHVDFYRQLPFVVAAARDARGRPWVTLLSGEPGFVCAPNERRLTLNATPGPGDALAGALAPGSDVGILGIELHSRRRNRVNGRVVATRAESLSIEVDQTFGNCPQYIHAREWEWVDEGSVGTLARRSPSLAIRHRDAIASSDTFFIGSGHPRATGAVPLREDVFGMDASHRGGPAGFVEVLDERTLLFPDYAGNNHFNTLGNLLLDPRAGISFVAFDTGSLLQLTGRTEIDWEIPDPSRYPGAQRLVRFHVEEVVEQPRVLPIRWRTKDSELAPLRLVDRVEESRDAVSFYFESVAGTPLSRFRPGQHLPIEIELGQEGAAVQRTYSLSNAPGGSRYRITVKREPRGLVSRFLHDELQVGQQVRARGPSGMFRLEADAIASDTPLLLVAAGIGITPLASMIHAIRKQNPSRRITLVHGVRDSAHHPLREELELALASHPQAHRHIRYSQPRDGDLSAGLCDSVGRIDLELLESVADLRHSQIYLCGPAAFMAEIEAGLAAAGVRESNLHFESF